jgi:hypothetical protein
MSEQSVSARQRSRGSERVSCAVSLSLSHPGSGRAGRERGCMTGWPRVGAIGEGGTEGDKNASPHTDVFHPLLRLDANIPRSHLSCKVISHHWISITVVPCKPGAVVHGPPADGVVGNGNRVLRHPVMWCCTVTATLRPNTANLVHRASVHRQPLMIDRGEASAQQDSSHLTLTPTYPPGTPDPAPTPWCAGFTSA